MRIAEWIEEFPAGDWPVQPELNSLLKDGVDHIVRLLTALTWNRQSLAALCKTMKLFKGIFADASGFVEASSFVRR